MPAPSMTPAPPPMQSPPPSTAIPSGQYKILVSVETLDANARPIGQFRIPGILWITPVQGSPNAVDIAFKVGEVFSATTPGAFSYHTNGALSTLSGVRSDSANAVPLATVRAQGSRLDFAANRPTNEAEMALMPNIYKNLFLVEAGVMAMPRAIISCEGSVESSGGNLIGSLIMSGINSSSNRAGAPNSGIRAQFTTVP